MNKAQTPRLASSFHTSHRINCVLNSTPRHLLITTHAEKRTFLQQPLTTMIFIIVFLLLFFQEVRSFPLYHLPNEKFRTISQEAFKKLDSGTWKVREIPALVGLPGKKQRNPSEVDINSTKLKELLADGFETKFMSETEPSKVWHENELDRQNEFDAFVKDASTKLLDRKRMHLNEVEFEDVRFWLWNATRCTVETSWKDFGAKVWPRYVNVGKCSSKTSCSLPSGMKCKPSDVKTIRLLYWVCPENLKKCFWSLFETSVIRACKCTC